MHLQVIEDLLSDLYNIYPLKMDLADVGHSGVSRRRLYVIVVTKHARMLADPTLVFQHISTHVRQFYRTEPKDYLIAGQLEVCMDALETARAQSFTSELISCWLDPQGHKLLIGAPGGS